MKRFLRAFKFGEQQLIMVLILTWANLMASLDNKNSNWGLILFAGLFWPGVAWIANFASNDN